MNLQSPDIPPDERIRRRAWLEHAIGNLFITREQADLWGFTALIEGKAKRPLIRTYPEHGGLGDEDRKAVLSLLQEGANPSTACLKLGIPYSRFKKEVSRDREFATEVSASTECMEGYCGEILAEAVVTTRDPKLAMQLLPTLANNRHKATEAGHKTQEMSIRRKLLKVQLRETQVFEANETRPDFSMLTPSQFKRYMELNDLAVEGRPFTIAEFTEFGQLVHCIIKRAAEKNGVATVDEKYKALDGPGNGHIGNGNGNGYSNGNGNGKH